MVASGVIGLFWLPMRMRGAEFMLTEFAFQQISILPI
jgi:hypothetical protein